MGGLRFLLPVFVLGALVVACGDDPQPDAASSDAPRTASASGDVASKSHAKPDAASDAGDDAGVAGAPTLAAVEDEMPGPAPSDGSVQASAHRRSGAAPSGKVSGDPGENATDEGSTSGIAAVTGAPEISVPANETIVSINTPTPTATRTSTPTPTSAPGSAPMVGGCQMFPSNNPWNTDISNYPVHPNSANFITAINAGGRTKLHPDWGGNGEYGIPYIVVPPNQPLVSVTCTAYGDESDPGPYPIPLNAPIEGGPSSDGDRHVLAVRQGECVLYELGRAFPGSNYWEADVGVRWPLNTNALRPYYWTSADAAGLPILAGLVRYDEVAAGQINHALRFTSWRSQRGFILPATHFASSYTDPNLPPMGLRFRLKASYDISGFTGQSRVVLEALKKYGMFMADNGSSWMITGAADPRWDDEDLNQIKSVPSSAFEAVYTGEVID